MTLEAEVQNLKERVARLESARHTDRGRTNQTGAAHYLGRSREWLRRMHLQGKGPKRGADGLYSYTDLDAFINGNV